MSSDILSLLGLAKRAKKLIIGEEQSSQAIIAHKVRLVILADDLADSTSKRIRRITSDKIPIMPLKCDKANLGNALGCDICGICCLTDMGFACKISALIAKENTALQPIADEIMAKQNKMLQRKKEKPKKKKLK